MDCNDFSRALLRGRSTIAAARMEARATPIDVGTLAVLQQNWSAIRLRLVERIDANFNVYEGTTFKANRFAAWLNRNGIAWPELPSGRPALDDETFSEMARLYPQLEPLRQLRNAMSQLRLNDLAIGTDGRTEPMYVVCIPSSHWPVRAKHQQVYFWDFYMASWANAFAARLRPRLCRLVSTGIRHRGCTLR